MASARRGKSVAARVIARTIAAAIAFVTAAAPAVAAAEPERVAFDWGRFLVDLDHFARTGAERTTSPLPTVHTNGAEPGGGLLLHNGGNAWFGVAPRASLVARDWGEAYRLAGDRLSLVDAMRLSSSTRMVVSRVRLSDTRFTPFAQLGLGQWRVDTNFLPLTPRSTELAGQFGGGFEFRLTSAWQLACESTVTAIYREQREADSIPQTKMWSTMIASRIEF